MWTVGVSVGVEVEVEGVEVSGQVVDRSCYDTHSSVHWVDASWPTERMILPCPTRHHRPGAAPPRIPDRRLSHEAIGWPRITHTPHQNRHVKFVALQARLSFLQNK